MNSQLLARGIYEEFKKKPESQHIASVFALEQLATLLDHVRPSRVLEIGAGIGTITKLLIVHPHGPQFIVATEEHPTCIRELNSNLAGLDKASLKLIKSPSELNTSDQFDLVIFDGTLDNDRQYEVLNRGTWCFVEGSRNKTITELSAKLAQRGLSVDFQRKLPGGQKFQFWTKRKIFGFRLPAFKIKPIKGCSFGLIR